MLPLKAVFEYQDRCYRVLAPVRGPGGEFLDDAIWCIDIDSPDAWPIEFSTSHAELLPRMPTGLSIRADLTDKEKALKDKAWAILARLVNDSSLSGNHLYHASSRKAAIAQLVSKLAEEAELAKTLGLHKETCSEPTLYKWLRRYWQRGMIPAALTPDYVKSGKHAKRDPKHSEFGITSSRGRQSTRFESFQIGPADLKNMAWAIEKKLAASKKMTLPDAWRELLTACYSEVDGNGESNHKPEGQCPSFNQFRYFYLRNYSAEARRKHKVTQREFNLNYRPQTGLAITESHGPGHQYEVDATIIECHCVTKSDRRRVIRKPTLYLVIDRWSRLIVGYCLTLDKPSWMAALLAILSISEDKEALCRKYGVTYVPGEWPAHTYFPQLFKADRGSEWTSQNSRLIVDDLGSTVENLPAGRAEMKPIVENAMKLILREYRRFERSSDPDAQRMKRQQPDYQKLASANMDELHKFTLEAIIKLNKTQYPDWPMEPEMLEMGLKPKPINLFNYGLRRTGRLAQFDAQTLVEHLLPRATATVNEHGIHVNGSTYWSQQAAAEGWFVEGHKKSFEVKVSHDPRSIDAIYVFPRNGRDGRPHVARLSERSARFAGRSLDEMDFLSSLDKDMRAIARSENTQEEQRFLDRVKPVSDKAFAEMKEATKGGTRVSRTKNIKQDWELEREAEHRQRNLVQERPSDHGGSSLPEAPVPPRNNPLHLVTADAETTTDAVSETPAEPVNSLAAQMAAFRQGRRVDNQT
ncbi:Mu transposase C-terminal domain-containing protein [Paucibacter sp. R3-3]|uniref:Mu transposase C-terminal domain-containing protein n=1 Tax=Roseateles agri TaxID=3098619 RepID=A0ABU5DES1_9BURK|nr:Mu transposase C-terminal domain-containing protein [Paucibacter sp. R3-3]MDY0744786.1 Mu transposase C-terminal domain-containing protein [Paucibacter sp. R3-3]